MFVPKSALTTDRHRVVALSGNDQMMGGFIQEQNLMPAKQLPDQCRIIPYQGGDFQLNCR